jgi:hypothetical protein
MYIPAKPTGTGTDGPKTALDMIKYSMTLQNGLSMRAADKTATFVKGFL